MSGACLSLVRHRDVPSLGWSVPAELPLATRAGVAYALCMPVEVVAHITGTVWKIEVKEGDDVAEEQTLVILESMKMEMPVESPQAGKVAKIVATEGQAVEEGDVLLTLE